MAGERTGRLRPIGTKPAVVVCKGRNVFADFPAPPAPTSGRPWLWSARLQGFDPAAQFVGDRCLLSPDVVERHHGPRALGGNAAEPLAQDAVLECEAVAAELLDPGADADRVGIGQRQPEARLRRMQNGADAGGLLDAVPVEPAKVF